MDKKESADMLAEVIQGYQDMDAAGRRELHRFLFSLTVRHMMHQPTLETIGRVLKCLAVIVWPDYRPWSLTALCGLLAVVGWAWAITAHFHPALMLACLCLAAVAWLKRPQLQTEP